MKASFRLSMQWLHTWTGAVAGYIIFLVFFNGSAAYFKLEITTWMKPEILAGLNPAASVTGAQAFLTTNAPGSASWTIRVPDKRYPVADVTWQPRPKQGAARVRRGDEWPLSERHATIDAAGKPLTTRDTQGGEYFAQFHFAFHYIPMLLGSILVGLASLALMVALTTGVITHRRIFVDFFTLRLKPRQRLWRDAHTTFAVLALPFHLMITYTGVTILAFFFIPWSAFANYPNSQVFLEDLVPQPAAAAPSGHAAPLASVNSVLRMAETVWRGGRAETIRINNPGDASATIEVRRQARDPLANTSANSLTFNGVTGALINTSSIPSTAATASSAVFNLHEAHFASPRLRLLLFMCGVSGAAMVASGLILWTEKRRKRLLEPGYGRRGLWLVETLNVAVIAGYPASVGAYFLANRLLPVSIVSRGDTEVLCAFGLWGLMLAWSVLRTKQRAWIETLGLGAVLFLALPAVSAATSSRGTVRSLMSGDAVYAGFDAICLAIGLLFAGVALRIGLRLASHAPPSVTDRESTQGLPSLDGLS